MALETNPITSYLKPQFAPFLSDVFPSTSPFVLFLNKSGWLNDGTMITLCILVPIGRCFNGWRSQVVRIHILHGIIAVCSFNSSRNPVFVFDDCAGLLSFIVTRGECRIVPSNDPLNPGLWFLDDKVEEKK